MRVLYLGDDALGSTARHRAQALRRLGHEVRHFDPQRVLKRDRLRDRIHYRTGYRLVGDVVRRSVGHLIEAEWYDLVWVGGGRQVSGGLIEDLKATGAVVVNYNNDDPFGGRDRGLWSTYLQALPCYDLVGVLREVNVPEAWRYGARDVIRVLMSYDEVEHRPRPLTPALNRQWASQVVFVGSWMPERGPFLAELLDLGVPLTLWGDRWKRAAEWKRLRSCWRGAFIAGARYAYAIQCARVSLGLLSSENRDLHTRRSVEVPALGGLLCAERTSEHQSMYREGEQAVFWSDAEECAALCHQLLRDPARRDRIARAGQRRVRELGASNEAVARSVVNQAMSS